MSDKLEFKKLREFGEIINDLFLFIKQNFKPLLKVFIYLCGFFILAGMVSTIIYQTGIPKGINNPNNPFNFVALKQLFTFNYLTVIIFSFANYAAINVSIFSFITLYIEKKNTAPTVEEVWAYFKYYYFRVLGSSIFVGLFLIICFALCLIPGIYVFPAMSLFFAVMIFENGSFSYSFGRAFRLLKNQWWVTAGAILIIWIITYACMSFVSLPAVIITMVGAFTQGSKGLSNTMIIISAVFQQLAYIFMILPIIGLSLCYFNLVERQESAGLIDRIHQLGATKDNFGHPEDY